MEDLKKLETLSYVPENHIDPELEKLYQENMVAVGMITVPCPGPECQHCQPIKTGCAVKSSNLGQIYKINEVERLISKANDKIHELPADAFLGTGNKHWEYKRIRDQAIEEIDLFQRTTLHELRKVFE